MTIRTCSRCGNVYRGYICPKCHPKTKGRAKSGLKFSGGHISHGRASDHLFSEHSEAPAVNAGAAAVNNKSRAPESMTFGVQMVNISIISVDPAIQQRTQTSFLIAGDYASDMEAGQKFPPIVCYFDGENLWLADGFHRLEAAKINHYKTIWTEVRDGTRRDAVLYAVGSNAGHGLRRTNVDKRRAVETLLRDSEWCKWSDREIARRACVSDRFVNALRAELSANNAQMERAERTVQRGGAVYTMRTERIGKDSTGEPIEAAEALQDIEIAHPAPALVVVPQSAQPATSTWAARFAGKPLLPHASSEIVDDDEEVPANWEGPAAAATSVVSEISLPAFVMDRDELMADLEAARHNNVVMRQNLEAAYSEIRELRAENERLRAMVPQMA